MAKGNGLIFLLFRFSSSPWCECVCALYFSRKNRVNALIWLFCLLWAFVRAQHMQHQVNAVWNSWIRDRCDYIHLYTHQFFRGSSRNYLLGFHLRNAKYLVQTYARSFLLLLLKQNNENEKKRTHSKFQNKTNKIAWNVYRVYGCR